MTKVKFTIPISIDNPNENGAIYTKEAVENAINNIHTNIPIIYRDGEERIYDKVVGTTTGNSHIVNWDSENQICKITLDGVLFNSGVETVINKIEDGKICSFEIVGVGLTT